MEKLDAARHLLEYQRLRLTGSPAAARRLIDALSSEDENVRTLAGMFLVRAGLRSVRSIRTAIAERHPAMTTSLAILGDIGGKEAEATLTRYATDSDPAVAEAAQDGLRVTAMKERRTSGDTVFRVDRREHGQRGP